eukprot:TRINITY_DN13582_c1_g1_i1.p1 TRINITY_DN13582_c1_g1~~TRINITY_DN13582_c1_g1_i1.p1  ORF type:complete len:479 (+),score=79.33 TRINITY_DN13582_c1_g1_i1:360-1796(+)
MELFREGSFRVRARKSDQLTSKLRELKKQKIAAQTHEALQHFEDSLNADKVAMSRAFDDIPTEAGGMAKMQRRSGSHLHHSDMGHTRSRSEPTLPAVNLNAAAHHDTEHDPRTKRPPSPLTFYEYGGISPKSKSRFTQHRHKIGEITRPEFRQTSSGFYFPGAHCKQGSYGDKLLEPCLMPPTGWSPCRTAPDTRWHGDAGDLRPLASQELQVGRNIHREGQLAPELVRTNVATEAKTRHVHHHINKRREEAVLEQARFENGQYEGCWRDPLLLCAALPEQGGAEDFSWLVKALTKLNSNTQDSELDLTPRQWSAMGLILRLEEALRRNKARMSDIFAAENHHSPKLQLEPQAFLVGLKRLGLIDAASFTEEHLAEAMGVLDPCYNGRVSLPVLSRCLRAVHRQMYSNFEKTLGRSFHGDRSQDKTFVKYGEAVPVDTVRLELQSDSIINFEKLFTKFRSQQKELLDHHGKRTWVLGV